MTIDRAKSGDLDTVVAILQGASAWLRSRGLDQWPEGFAPPERIRPYIDRGEAWLVRDDGHPVATIKISAHADADAANLWTPAERRELALYLSKLAINQTYAGKGLGALVLRWAIDQAAQLGCKWARLDAWRTNADLLAYYESRGWLHVRTVEVPWRNSTALFQRPAKEDLAARRVFMPQSSLPREGRS